MTSSKQNPSTPSIRPHFSPGEDENQLMAETTSLLGCRWTLDEEQKGFQKAFNFPTYAKALDFIILVGVESKLKNHHPELRNNYKSVYYHWTTHKPSGLSAKDTHMARFCDDKARYLGQVDENEGSKDATAPSSHV